MNPGEIADCPYYLLTRASLATTAMMRAALERAGLEGLHPSYLGALLCLWSEDGRQAGALGRCAGQEPSTMTGLLDRMERAGLVERRIDPRDRRAVRIFLTAAGQRAQGPVRAVVDTVLAAMTDGLAADDVERAKHTLRQILANTAK